MCGCVCVTKPTLVQEIKVLWITALSKYCFVLQVRECKTLKHFPIKLTRFTCFWLIVEHENCESWLDHNMPTTTRCTGWLPKVEEVNTTGTSPPSTNSSFLNLSSLHSLEDTDRHGIQTWKICSPVPHVINWENICTYTTCYIHISNKYISQCTYIHKSI